MSKRALICVLDTNSRLHHKTFTANLAGEETSAASRNISPCIVRAEQDKADWLHASQPRWCVDLTHVIEGGPSAKRALPCSVM